MVSIKVDCATCEDKCCSYPGWKVFFLEEERERVAEKYGEATASKISVFQARRGDHNVYAIDLPCPFFESETGKCGIYDAQPFVCRLFPVEVEPITGTTYLEEKVCPKRDQVQPDWRLIQIDVASWCDKFWGISPAEEVSDSGPVGEQSPQAT